MDFSDHATQQEELMRELALKRAANKRLPCPQSGRVTGAMRAYRMGIASAIVIAGTCSTGGRRGLNDD